MYPSQVNWLVDKKSFDNELSLFSLFILCDSKLNLEVLDCWLDQESDLKTSSPDFFTPFLPNDWSVQIKQSQV